MTITLHQLAIMDSEETLLPPGSRPLVCLEGSEDPAEPRPASVAWLVWSGTTMGLPGQDQAIRAAWARGWRHAPPSPAPVQP